MEGKRWKETHNPNVYNSGAQQVKMMIIIACICMYRLELTFSLEEKSNIKNRKRLEKPPIKILIIAIGWEKKYTIILLSLRSLAPSRPSSHPRQLF